MFKRKAGQAVAPNPQTFIVQAEGLTSLEVYQSADGSRAPVLQGIDLAVRRGECWGILGQEPFELELLMEIIGCVRPYGQGRVVLVERGMMRKKRKILPHVFYISEGDMTFPNMNTLEYLMFATAHQSAPARERQAAILRLLLDTGLHGLTLVPLKHLSRAERAVVSLMAASFSSALLVIFAAGQLRFDKRLSDGLQGIAQAIAGRGAALVMAAQDCDMVQAACTHVAFLKDGAIRHSGAMEEMLSRLDKRVFLLECDDPQGMAALLAKACPRLSPVPIPSGVHVYDYGQTPITQGEMFEVLLKTGRDVAWVAASRKSLEIAYREALLGHDV